MTRPSSDPSAAALARDPAALAARLAVDRPRGRRQARGRPRGARPGPRQPHRRAHRLQRRLRAARWPSTGRSRIAVAARPTTASCSLTPAEPAGTRRVSTPRLRRARRAVDQLRARRRRWPTGGAGYRLAACGDPRLRTMPAGAGLSSSAALEVVRPAALSGGERPAWTAGVARIGQAPRTATSGSTRASWTSSRRLRRGRITRCSSTAATWITASCRCRPATSPSSPPPGSPRRLAASAYNERWAQCEAAGGIAALCRRAALRDARVEMLDGRRYGRRGAPARADHVFAENARTLEAIAALDAGDLAHGRPAHRREPRPPPRSVRRQQPGAGPLVESPGRRPVLRGAPHRRRLRRLHDQPRPPGRGGGTPGGRPARVPGPDGPDAAGLRGRGFGGAGRIA